MKSPTARSLAHLRQQGAMAQVVEHWNHFSGRRHDLFGFIDIVAVDDQPGVLGVQTTSASNVSARMTKLRDECAGEMRRWLLAKNRLVVHGWAKRGPRGKRKTWSVSERWVTSKDLYGV